MSAAISGDEGGSASASSMAATRAALRSLRARSPATPALRRTIDTPRATAVAPATRAAPTSLPGAGSVSCPATTAPTARSPNTERSSQPYPMPTSRRRVVTHRKAKPPVAHCSSTVAASRGITAPRVFHQLVTVGGRAVTDRDDGR